MDMPAKRRLWIVSAWVGTAVAAAFLTWAAGFLYWHIRIKSAIADLKRDALTLPEDEVGFRTTCWLPQARGRGIPYMVRELGEAGVRSDRNLMIMLSWEITDAYQASRVSDLSSYAMIASHDRHSSLWSLKDSASRSEAWWSELRPQFPPWWVWWSGKRLPE